MALLKNAKVLETGVKEAGKAKAKRATLEIKGMELISNLDAVIKACTAAKAIAEEGLDETLWNQFLKNRGGEGDDAGPGVKPESFNATDGLAIVNVQCRKRGENSALKPEEIALINKIAETIKNEKLKEKFKPKEVELTPALIAINPAYAENTALMDKVEKALEKIAGIPDDFIVVQKRKTKTVVDEAFEAAAWEFGNSEIIKLASCLGLRPSLSVVDPKKIGATIQDLFDIDNEDESSTEEVMVAITQKKTKAMKPIAALEGGKTKATAEKKAVKK